MALVGLLSSSIETTSISTAAIMARLKAPFQVGGRSYFSRRLSRADFVLFARPVRSALVGGRPVRPRASTMPAGLPGYALRWGRRVWAAVACAFGWVVWGGWGAALRA